MEKRVQGRGIILRVMIQTLAVVLVLLVAGAVMAYRHYRERAGQYDLSLAGQLPQRNVVYDGDGRVVAWIDGENRQTIPLSQVPADFVKALLVREDARFWEHDGFDWKGICRAFLVNLREGGIQQGGSTLTQQLVRNTFDLGGRTWDRKLLEAMLTRRFEAAFSKRQLLHWYINCVYYGDGAYGLERAAQEYFNRPASKLTLAQSATLAGLIRSPNRYSPASHPKEATIQRNQVLDRMMELGVISRADYEEARAAPMETRAAPPLPNPQGYVMDAIRREMGQALTGRRINLGGLKVYTTFDPKLQATAEKVMEEELTRIESQKGWPHPRRPKEGLPKEVSQTPYLQGAVVAIENRTGAIRALVGGRSYHDSRFDRATLAQRQVGSTFKPFVYTLAFERGLNPASPIDDSRIAPGEYRDIPKSWSPSNSDGEYGGLKPMEIGLVKSRNTMSVRVGEYVGLRAVLAAARLLGLGNALPPYPAIFLGGFETTLRQMAGAFTVFPNRGARAQPHLISRIEDDTGKVLYRAPVSRVPVFARSAAWTTSDLLEEVLQSGTGARARRNGFTLPAAGKTGTTNRHRDAWFVGYTSSLTCGVWVGFDRPKTISHGGYGATLALPIWVRLMETAPENRYPALSLIDPERTTEVVLCQESQRLAVEGCYRAHTAYRVVMRMAMAPKTECTIHAKDFRELEADAAPTPPPVAEWLEPETPPPKSQRSEKARVQKERLQKQPARKQGQPSSTPDRERRQEPRRDSYQVPPPRRVPVRRAIPVDPRDRDLYYLYEDGPYRGGVYEDGIYEAE
ncbi:MAG TPA: PBP1A family penicillin-binding protein [Chthoniobacteraceae bacterium]|nr:PBP1A family penicillin-binding protein [Chthoniobacteraceae bacterium]